MSLIQGAAGIATSVIWTTVARRIGSEIVTASLNSATTFSDATKFRIKTAAAIAIPAAVSYFTQDATSFQTGFSCGVIISAIMVGHAIGRDMSTTVQNNPQLKQNAAFIVQCARQIFDIQCLPLTFLTVETLYDIPIFGSLAATVFGYQLGKFHAPLAAARLARNGPA